MNSVQSPVTASDYARLSGEIINSCMEYIESDGWVHYDESNGLEILEKEFDGSDISSVKTTCTIRLGSGKTIKDALMLIYNPTDDEKKKMYETLVFNEKIKDVTNKISIAHTEFNASSLSANREFILMRTFEELEEGGYVICNKSVNVGIPLNSEENVEGHVVGCCILEIGDDPNTFILTSMNHVEPNGWIPATVVNSFKSSSTEWIVAFQDLLDP